MSTHYVVNTTQDRVVAILHESMGRSVADGVADFLSVMTQEKHYAIAHDDLPESMFAKSADMLMTETTAVDVVMWAEHVARESAEGSTTASSITERDVRLACAIQNVVSTCEAIEEAREETQAAMKGRGL
jgi:hypothetical protein